MDPNVIHIVLTALCGGIVSYLLWLVKSKEGRLMQLERDLQDHKLADASEFAQLNAHKDEVMRRLDGIDAKLDRILEKR